MRVALEGVTVEELRLRARPPAVEPAAVRTLAALLPAREAGGPFEPALAAALASYRDCGDPAVLAVLVGIGEGLTPSGDDLVVGALAALDALGDDAGRARLGAALAGCAVRTTKLAAQMIEAALDGRHAEPVLGVLEALAGAAGAARRRRGRPARRRPPFGRRHPARRRRRARALRRDQLQQHGVDPLRIPADLLRVHDVVVQPQPRGELEGRHAARRGPASGARAGPPRRCPRRRRCPP